MSFRVDGKFRALLATSCAALALSGCASDPERFPLKVELESETVLSWSGLTPALVVTDDDEPVLFEVNPREAWGTPRMKTPELQAMVDQCAVEGHQTVDVRAASVRDAKGRGVASLPADAMGYVDLVGLSGKPVGSGFDAEGATVKLAVDPTFFRGRIQLQTQTTFRDGEAPVAPALYATVESATEVAQEMRVGARTAKVHYLYLKLHNRGYSPIGISGADTGAAEQNAERMLTLSGPNSVTLTPGAAAILRLPVELSGDVSLASGPIDKVTLLDYLSARNGVIGPRLAGSVPLRIQVGIKAAGGRISIGRFNPVMDVFQTYRIERPGCF